MLDTVLSRLPRPARDLLHRHAELVKFAVVGGSMFILDTAILFGLKSTIMESHPVTAKVISSTVATIASYYLNREWSFNSRGGRRRRNEMILFFAISVLAIGLTAAPMWVSRYGLQLHTPHISRVAQEMADFVSAQIIGTLIAMGFRYWAFRRFVFPEEQARPQIAERDIDRTAAELLGDVWPLIDEPTADLALAAEAEVVPVRQRRLRDAEDAEDPLRAG